MVIGMVRVPCMAEVVFKSIPISAMRLSIIVPVYNNPQDLRECLAALIASAGPDSEIIVVDDASTDDTPSVAAQMGVRVLRLAKNSGPAAARNYGARHAQGEILFFVDADVVIAPDAVRRVIKAVCRASGPGRRLRVLRCSPPSPRHRFPISQPAPSLRASARQSGGFDVLGRVWRDPTLSLPRRWRLRCETLSDVPPSRISNSDTASAKLAIASSWIRRSRGHI